MSKNRYEIKFVLNELEYHEAKCFLKIIKAFTSFPERNVNSVYFDTLEFKSVKDNISGISERKKVRLRWYEKAEFSPVIEIKNRFSRLGSKNNFKIKFLTPENLNSFSSRVVSKKIFKYIRDENRENSFFYNYYFPVLGVSYDREYYETKEGLRITIDKKISFKPITLDRSVKFHKKINYEKRVMELKFPVELKDHVNELIRNLNLTPKRHSKYLVGLSKIGYANYV